MRIFLRHRVIKNYNLKSPSCRSWWNWHPLQLPPYNSSLEKIPELQGRDNCRETRDQRMSKPDLLKNVTRYFQNLRYCYFAAQEVSTLAPYWHGSSWQLSELGRRCECPAAVSPHGMKRRGSAWRHWHPHFFQSSCFPVLSDPGTIVGIEVFQHFGIPPKSTDNRVLKVPSAPSSKSLLRPFIHQNVQWWCSNTDTLTWNQTFLI